MNKNKPAYERPEAEELIVRMEAAILSVGNNDFNEDDDDIFGDGGE